MSNQDRGRRVLALEPIRGRDQIANVRGERRIREIAFRAPQAREIEAQDSDARVGKRFADEGRRLAFLGAGEAVRE